MAPTSTTLLLFVIAAPLLALLGAVSIALGLRGRRMGDHPHCRKCGFDLFGKPENATRCSECGADLGRERAAVVGLKRRRTPMIVIGAVMVIAAAWASVVACRTVDWIRYAPATWLVDDMMRDQGSYPTAAGDELERRLAAGSLWASTRKGLASRILAYHADPNAPWHIDAGNLLVDLRRNGDVGDAAWESYLRNSVELDIAARPVMKVGGTNPVWLIMRGHHGGYGKAGMRTHFHDVGVSFELIGSDRNFKKARGGSMNTMTDKDNWSGFGFQRLSAEQPGDYELVVRGKITHQSTPWVDKTVEFPLEFVRKIKVVPADESPVTFVSDDTRANAMRASVRVSARRRATPPALDVQLMFVNTPEAICADVYVAQAGRRWLIGHTAAAHPVPLPHYNAQFFKELDAMSGFDVSAPFELILEPNALAAEQSPFVVRAWGKPIIIEALSVREERN